MSQMQHSVDWLLLSVCGCLVGGIALCVYGIAANDAFFFALGLVFTAAMGGMIFVCITTRRVPENHSPESSIGRKAGT